MSSLKVIDQSAPEGKLTMWLFISVNRRSQLIEKKKVIAHILSCNIRIVTLTLMLPDIMCIFKLL